MALGIIFNIISRVIPPPTAVTIASSVTPKISLSCLIPLKTPEAANAITPIKFEIYKKVLNSITTS